MNTVVEARQLTKSYSGVMAVNRVSFRLEAGKIYGLLGRNGAGKTTLMRIMTAQQFATSGEVMVFGEKPYENSQVLRQVCFVRESQAYPRYFRVIDVLETAPLFFPKWDRDYALALTEEFRLPLNRRMKALSRGMLSAVGIVLGLASRAPLTIFDEPYLGLDAVARGVFYNRLLEDYAEYPRTILVSTHLIDEVSRLLEHILVLDQGTLILDQDAEALRGRAGTVIGPAEMVDVYTADKQLLHREPFGVMVSATVLGAGNAGDRKQAEMLGLQFASVSLQQLIVHLTRDESDRKAAEVR